MTINGKTTRRPPRNGGDNAGPESPLAGSDVAGSAGRSDGAADPVGGAGAQGSLGLDNSAEPDNAVTLGNDATVATGATVPAGTDPGPGDGGSGAVAGASVTQARESADDSGGPARLGDDAGGSDGQPEPGNQLDSGDVEVAQADAERAEAIELVTGMLNDTVGQIPLLQALDKAETPHLYQVVAPPVVGADSRGPRTQPAYIRPERRPAAATAGAPIEVVAGLRLDTDTDTCVLCGKKCDDVNRMRQHRFKMHAGWMLDPGGRGGHKPAADKPANQTAEAPAGKTEPVSRPDKLADKAETKEPSKAHELLTFDAVMLLDATVCAILPPPLADWEKDLIRKSGIQIKVPKFVYQILIMGIIIVPRVKANWPTIRATWQRRRAETEQRLQAKRAAAQAAAPPVPAPAPAALTAPAGPTAPTAPAGPTAPTAPAATTTKVVMIAADSYPDLPDTPGGK